MGGSSGGELGFVDWLRRQIPADPRVKVGPGDDAAVLGWPDFTGLVVTTDMLLDGSCFILAEAGPRRVGGKAMAVNLSDIAAMAARPLAAVVSVGLPRTASGELPRELYLGLNDVAAEFDVAIVGGDTNTWEGPLAVSVTVFGAATLKGPVLRTGARPGDWLFVTGPLGGSIRGKNQDFTPRVREALALHDRLGLHAMIDISDGFALDLHRVCEASGCGALIAADRIPLSDAATRMGDEKSPLLHALSDGEDFELLFAVSAADGASVCAGDVSLPFPVFHVGDVIADRRVLLAESGTLTELPPLGYEHTLSPEIPPGRRKNP
jgi:thiamine-monophosphate kinase